VPTSAKTGVGVQDVLEAVVEQLPPPNGDPDAPLQALLFDSWFDSYRGVVILTRVREGRMKKGTRIKLWQTGKVFEVQEVGAFTPKSPKREALMAWEGGFVSGGIKDIHQTKIGDTIADADRPCAEALPGFKEVNPLVFAGIFPVDGKDYHDLKEALEKLQLND